MIHKEGILVENDKKNKKACCYLAGACDLVCFVFGSYLFSLALIGKTCTAVACSACCGCLSSLGLPLIALGFVIRSWCSKCCSSTCSDSNSDS